MRCRFRWCSPGRWCGAPSRVKVWFWLCTCTPVKVTGVVFIEGQATLGGGEGVSQWFGDWLHVAVFRVAPNSGAFPTDTILSYNMEITSLRDEPKGDVGLQPDDISYSKSYPSFVLPGPTTKTIVMQGSCRKIKGAGKDAMKSADEYLGGQASDPLSRPQQLVFTGDQIYADDVAAESLRLGQTLGPILVGFDENVPTPDTGAREGHHKGRGNESTPASLWSGGSGVFDRGPVLRGDGENPPRFTFDKGAGDNHLVAFCEFATTYLLMWSGVFWEFAKFSFPFVTNKEQWPPDGTYNMASAAAQRVLANVPSYMMCDDHEVTDDWFIDQPFLDSVLSDSRPLFGRVVANALAAYWLFQAWGNQPSRFGYLQSEVTEYVRTETASFPKKIIQFHWDFITPAPPSIVMLDTRTRRVLSSQPVPSLLHPFQAPNAPGLLNEGALGDCPPRWRSSRMPRSRRFPTQSRRSSSRARRRCSVTSGSSGPSTR